MLFDSGLCKICSVSWDEASIPKKRILTEKATLPFGDRTVGVTRFNEAARNDARIDRLIRFHRYPVSPKDVCVIEGTEYKIYQVQLTTDEDGILTTDLTLEVLESGQNRGG